MPVRGKDGEEEMGMVRMGRERESNINDDNERGEGREGEV